MNLTKSWSVLGIADVLTDTAVEWQLLYQRRRLTEWLLAVAASTGGQTGLCPGCKPFYSGCAPAGKPSSFHSIIQHQFFAFHSTIFHTNRGQLLPLMASEHGILKANFETFPGVTPRTPCRRGLSHPATTPSRAFGPDHQPQQNCSVLRLTWEAPSDRLGLRLAW